MYISVFSIFFRPRKKSVCSHQLPRLIFTKKKSHVPHPKLSLGIRLFLGKWHNTVIPSTVYMLMNYHLRCIILIMLCFTIPDYQSSTRDTTNGPVDIPAVLPWGWVPQDGQKPDSGWCLWPVWHGPLRLTLLTGHVVLASDNHGDRGSSISHHCHHPWDKIPSCHQVIKSTFSVLCMTLLSFSY